MKCLYTVHTFLFVSQTPSSYRPLWVGFSWFRNSLLALKAWDRTTYACMMRRETWCDVWEIHLSPTELTPVGSMVSYEQSSLLGLLWPRLVTSLSLPWFVCTQSSTAHEHVCMTEWILFKVFEWRWEWDDVYQTTQTNSDNLNFKSTSLIS